jgi:hypothetical protein
MMKGKKMPEEFDVKQWLASRKEAGLEIDPETAEVCWKYAQVMDPYGVRPDLPEEYQQVGRLLRSLPRERHMGRVWGSPERNKRRIMGAAHIQVGVPCWIRRAP